MRRPDARARPSADVGRGLRAVLGVKLALTVALWAGPLVAAPVPALLALGFPRPEPLLFVRLLGVAYAALAVGYALGLRDARRGLHPEAAVWVGVASNGAAAVVLGLGAAGGAWTGWGAPAQAYMWGSLVATTAVTAGLVWWGLGAPAAWR